MNTATVEANTEDLNELAKFEQGLMADLEKNADRGLLPEHRDPADAEIPPAPAAPVTQPAAVTAPAPVPQTINPVSTPAPAPAEPDPRDNATRAARHAERQARKAAREATARAEALQAELDALKTANGVPKDDDAETLARVEADYPDIAKLVKKVLVNTNSPPAAAAPEPEFIQHTELEDAAQDAVDEVPELLTWLTTKEHGNRWKAAQRQQGAIEEEPAWRDKSLVDQLHEAVRRVNAAFSKQTPDPRAAAAAVIDNTQARVPETLSGLRGGVAPSNQEPDFRNMKTDEEIFASLDAKYR